MPEFSLLNADVLQMPRGTNIGISSAYKELLYAFNVERLFFCN